MSSKLIAFTPTCTLTPSKTRHGIETWKAKFNPGLPYDKMTKGCPHTDVTVTIFTIQNPSSHQGEDHFVFSNPEVDYIYSIRKTVRNPRSTDLKLVIKGMGYKIMDTDEALAEVAISKLTDEEYGALLRNCNKLKRKVKPA